ncbi:hypothetical protein PIB30_067065, partial [Stylosanthes scabra]|nr:hypothetical protein [Stylosanthes scabra]
MPLGKEAAQSWRMRSQCRMIGPRHWANGGCHGIRMRDWWKGSVTQHRDMALVQIVCLGVPMRRMKYVDSIKKGSMKSRLSTYSQPTTSAACVPRGTQFASVSCP